MKRRLTSLAGWGALVVVLGAFGMVAPSWMRNWGATAEERARPIPGEEALLPTGRAVPETRALDVHAPPAVTWEWLRRIGQGRGGFYSYDWLENLFGDDVHNRRELFPAAPLAVGDTIRLTQETYPGARAGLSLLPITQVTPGRSFVLQGWGAFVVESLAPDRSRILVRERPPAPANVLDATFRTFIFEPAHFVMERQMLRGVRDRAENVPPATFASLAATIGLAAGGAAIAAFLVRRRRWWWLLPPLALAAFVLAVTGGVEGALAGFVALGVPGVLRTTLTRNRMLALTGLLGLVLLMILAAADAYVTIGWLVGALAGAYVFVRWVPDAEPGRA